MTLEGTARTLGKHLKHRTDRGPQFATVVGVDGRDTRSLVECELMDGTPVNAIAWGDAELERGTEVVLMPIQGRHKQQWAIMSANAPTRKDEPPRRNHIGYRTQGFIPSLPRKKNGFRVLEQTQQLVDLPRSTFTELRVRLRFADGPTDSRVRYDLFLYHPNKYNFKQRPSMDNENNPGLIIEGIGAPKGDGWTWQSDDKKRYRTRVDLDELIIGADDLGAIALWEEWDEVLAVLAIVRIADTTTKVRPSQIGKVQRFVLTFGRPLTGIVELSATDELLAIPYIDANPEAVLSAATELIVSGGAPQHGDGALSAQLAVAIDDTLVEVTA